MSFSMQLSVINFDKLAKKLEMIPKDQDKVLQDALALSALAVQNTAIKSIRAHESKGETYTRGSIEHTASKPGYPPNSDTGTLIRSIRWELDTSKNLSLVGTNLNYGAWLEFGTKDMAARPWLFPAYKENHKKIIQTFTEAIKKALK